MRYEFGGLIFGGAYTWRGLFSEFYGNRYLYRPSANVRISLGMGKHFQLASVKAICASLGPHTSRAMPLLHCFTVCDTTSCFKGKGKRSAWEAWRSYREVTDVFLYLAYKPYYHLDKEEDFGIFAHNFPTSGTVGYSGVGMCDA